MSIELKNVTYTYSQGTAYESHALKDINLVIPDGQFIGVIGHTGSGKSTLIQHFNALIQPTSGQKKRVAIAGVLAMNPKILILDEPTAGLDPQGRDDILDQIAALHKMRGITIILVSHSMEDIAKYVERLIVMNHGEMVFDDTPKNVFSHYKELEGMGLAAPQITYIMHALFENGLNVDTTATTVEEARDTILEALKKQKPSLLKKGGRSE